MSDTKTCETCLQTIHPLGTKPVAYNLPEHTVHTCKLVEVIEVVFTRGLGVEGDAVRSVTQYWDRDGRFLAEIDPFQLEEQK